ncbi:MAG: hypothetical protein NC095_00310 [Muribaculum sp.]|nr:hypothetical protein [Muribaculum sp.]
MCILSSAMDGSDFDSNANPASPVGARIWRGFLIFQCFGMAIQIDFAQRNLGSKPMDAEFAPAIKMYNYFVRVL